MFNPHAADALHVSSRLKRYYFIGFQHFVAFWNECRRLGVTETKAVTGVKGKRPPGSGKRSVDGSMDFSSRHPRFQRPFSFGHRRLTDLHQFSLPDAGRTDRYRIGEIAAVAGKHN